MWQYGMLETYTDPCRPDSKLSLSETMREISQRWRRDAGLEAYYLSVCDECNVSSSYCQVPRIAETVSLGVTTYWHSEGHGYFSIISCSFFQYLHYIQDCEAKENNSFCSCSMHILVNIFSPFTDMQSVILRTTFLLRTVSSVTWLKSSIIASPCISGTLPS